MDNQELIENLKQSVDHYRQLFENNLAAVFRSEIGGGLVEVNQALADIFGYNSLNELKKASARDLYYSEQDREAYIQELRKKGYLKNHQMQMRKRDGSEIWILENVMLVKDTKTNR